MFVNEYGEVSGGKMEVLSKDEHSASIQISGENGHFLITGYQVFPGITLTFSDAHIQTVHFEERKMTSNDVIEISYCREGRLECNIHDEFCYLASGDFVIAQTNGISPALYFPLRHYHGLTIQIELNKTIEGFFALFNGAAVEPGKIAEKFCGKKGGVIAHANSFFERIFSELYCSPVRNQIGYFQVKILELLLFLNGTDVLENELEERCYTKSQVELAKKISRYMLERINEHITLEQLEEYFHMSGAHIKKTFKGVYGVPIAAYIRTQKMESAVYMLEYTDKTILEIANEHGYNNGSKFASAFRSVKGCNPTEYRNQFSKK